MAGIMGDMNNNLMGLQQLAMGRQQIQQNEELAANNKVATENLRKYYASEQSGNPDFAALQEAFLLSPDMSQRMLQGAGITDKRKGQDAASYAIEAYGAIDDPERFVDLTQKRIQYLQAQGRDASQSIGALEAYMGGKKEQVKNGTKLLLASLTNQGYLDKDVYGQLAGVEERARKAGLEERAMAVDERQAAAAEERTKNMTPFERAQVKHWNDAAASDGGGLSADAIELFADRLLKGEQPNKVLANLGRGAQGAADLRAVQNRLAAKAKESGVDATKLLQNTQNVYADNRTFLELGAREGKIAPRVQEANLFANIALKASSEVPREKFVPWNKLSQYTSKQLSDPKLAALHAATQSLVNAYASAVGGGVMTEGNRQEANRMLYDAQGPEAYNAVVNQMLIETKAALDSPKQVREHMHAQPESASASSGGWSIRPAGGK